MKRILIFEVNWLGDILFTTPAIRAIRQKFKDAHIAVVVVPRCYDMLSDNPNIDELIVFDEEKEHKGFFGKLKFISQLKSGKYDTFITFHRSMTRVLLAFLAGIKRRVGYYTSKRAWLLTDALPQPEKEPHRVDYFLGITKHLGCSVEDRNYEFVVNQDSVDKSNNLLRSLGISNQEDFIVINPGGNWLPKRWAKGKYADLCKRLNEKYNKKIVVTGADKDEILADDIIRLSEVNAINLCGKTDIKELAAVMRRAEIVIANDSGPMHIAVSQKTPTVALFGPTSADITGPTGDSKYTVISKWYECNIPCYNHECKDYRCMDAISVDDVLVAVDNLLS
ncbi:MAG: lipopolysaccharide heptosyltransferase II [Candidatus Omnitrophota bacterium]